MLPREPAGASDFDRVAYAFSMLVLGSSWKQRFLVLIP